MTKREPLVVYLDKKFLLAFRITMLIVSLPFLHDIYTVLSTGVANSGGVITEKGEGWGYYAYLFKKLAFAFLFIWLGTFGAKDKTQAPKDE